MPKKNIFWFVEKKDTGQWVSEKDSLSLTRDPGQALKFPTQLRAIEFCIVNKLGLEFIQTEHEFV